MIVNCPNCGLDVYATKHNNLVVLPIHRDFKKNMLCDFSVAPLKNIGEYMRPITYEVTWVPGFVGFYKNIYSFNNIGYTLEEGNEELISISDLMKIADELDNYLSNYKDDALTKLLGKITYILENK